MSFQVNNIYILECTSYLIYLLYGNYCKHRFTWLEITTWAGLQKNWNIKISWAYIHVFIHVGKYVCVSVGTEITTLIYKNNASKSWPHTYTYIWTNIKCSLYEKKLHTKRAWWFYRCWVYKILTAQENVAIGISATHSIALMEHKIHNDLSWPRMPFQ